MVNRFQFTAKLQNSYLAAQYANSKLYWRWTAENVWKSLLFPRVNCWTTRSVLNYFLSLSAFLGNALILIAFHKASSLHPPSKLLLRNLATADLCVGLISEPLFVTYYCKSVVNGHWNICRYTLIAGYITGNILCSVSLLTITAISVDRLLALFLGLRYKQVVKRTYLIVVTFWVVSTVFSAMWFWNPRITMWYGIIV